MSANKVKQNAKYFDSIANLDSLSEDEKMAEVAKRFCVKKEIYNYLFEMRKFLFFFSFIILVIFIDGREEVLEVRRHSLPKIAEIFGVYD